MDTPRGLSSCSHDSCFSSCFSNWLFPLIWWFWFRCLNQVRDNVKKALKLRWTSAQCHNATMPSSWTRFVRVSCPYIMFSDVFTSQSSHFAQVSALSSIHEARHRNDFQVGRLANIGVTLDIQQAEQLEQLEQLDCSSQITLSVTIYKNHQTNLMINYQQITTDHNRS